MPLQRKFLSTAVFAVAATLSAQSVSACVAYSVTVDTSAVNGTPGFIDLQFNPGPNLTQPAAAQVSDFSIAGGALTIAPQIVGDVTGALPGLLQFDNTAAVNDYFGGVVFGSSFSFLLTLCGPAIVTPNNTATSGSTFSVSLYDNSQSPILTNQASGAAGQVDINLDGTTTATAFPTASKGLSVVTFAPSVLPGAYQVRYSSNLNLGDSIVNITNTGATAGTDPAGRICANVYVFDATEEMISCCSCIVTPNGLDSLSAQKDLIDNPLTPGVPTAIAIALLASTPNGNQCNPATPTFTNSAAGLLAWGTSLHQAPGGAYVYTETPFANAVLSPSELNKFTFYCSFIQTNGSGYGICNSCREGALGAVTKK